MSRAGVKVGRRDEGHLGSEVGTLSAWGCWTWRTGGFDGGCMVLPVVVVVGFRLLGKFVLGFEGFDLDLDPGLRFILVSCWRLSSFELVGSGFWKCQGEAADIEVKVTKAGRSVSRLGVMEGAMSNLDFLMAQCGRHASVFCLLFKVDKLRSTTSGKWWRYSLSMSPQMRVVPS